MTARIAIAASIGLLITLASGAPAAQEPQRATGTITEGVTAVLVDVVVRDRRGQPVRDLKPDEFEVLEDGVPQKVGSFSAVFTDAPAPSAAARPPAAAGGVGAATAPSDAPDGPLVTAMVFDRLTPEARRLAVQAAQSYLGSQELAPNHIGIYGIDLALTAYTPFTRNAVVLRQALERMASRGSAGFNNAELKQQRMDAERRAGSGPGAVSAGGGPEGGAAAGAAAAAGVDAMLAQMQADSLRDFEALERDQQGYSTTNGLFAVINALAPLPGRKSVVLFSEGVAIPTAVQRLFLGVIDAANRANVSIYTIDAAGLRTESQQGQMRDQVNAAAQRGINTGYSAGGRDGGPLTKTLEANEDTLRQDPEGSLGRLAQYTGGLMFNNTNNLRQGLQRIDEDLRNYYLLGYTPTNESLDGSFRNIDVRVKRPGVTVAARRGYFAVRDPGGAPVNAWEAPALGALEKRPVPNAFPVRATALLFPERGRPGLVPVLVEFGTAPLTFQPAEDGKTYSSDFAVLVRFVDQRNTVVRRVGQPYQVNGPIDQMENAGRGEVIFYREPELPPGTYTMETVVHDALSGKSSVRFSTVEVPSAADGALRMSSVFLVKGGEPVAEADRRADNPLLVNGVALRPNLGEPVSKGAAKDVTFYFTVYQAAGGPRPDCRIELLHNGARVAHIPMLVAEPDANGRSQQLGRLPIATLAPGTYELVASVKQGDDFVSRSTVMRIVE